MRGFSVLSVVLALGGAARAAEPSKASFALIVGVNRSADARLAALRYADDDAARYQDLFRSLGARTYLLTRPDENTRRLHPQAVAEAGEPRERELARVVGELARDIAQARARHVQTVFYFVYAGHGDVRGGEGAIALEDRWLTGKDLLANVLGRVQADQAHLIVDACYSYFLAYSRGPAGGRRRAVRGFSQLESLAHQEHVGLLLSTSSARESHEWEAFQAGVFSHEVRSGLYGAADADGDGQVSYREIAAFVERANSAIPNERFRPDVYARPPRDTGQLLDLRQGLGRRLEIPGNAQGHYLLEDGRGSRLAEFHSAPGQSVTLLRPAAPGALYLERLDDQQEFAIPSAPDVVALASLSGSEARAGGRGAAHEAFSAIFSLPFDRGTVERFDLGAAQAAAEREPPRPGRGRRLAGWTAVGVGTAALGAGIAMTLSAMGLRDSAPPGTSQVDLVSRNADVNSRNSWAMVLYGTAGAAVAAGVLLLVWPDGQAPLEVMADRVLLRYEGSF